MTPGRATIVRGPHRAEALKGYEVEPDRYVVFEQEDPKELLQTSHLLLKKAFPRLEPGSSFS